MSRRTAIVDEELFEDENFEEEVFTIISAAFKDEQRLLKRFYDFCGEYVNFEYDESGNNIDQSNDIVRKINKIRDLILSNIEEKLTCRFDNTDSNIQEKVIKSDISIQNAQYTITIRVLIDGFHLELL